MTKKTVVICCSAHFYKHAAEIADQLQRLGFNTAIPYTANKMRASGNYDVEIYKTWFNSPKDFDKKTDYMRKHFKEIEDGDIILLINDDKQGKPNYVGPNGLIELGLAFYLKKPIYVLNPVPKTALYYEEIMGMNSTILKGDLSKIK
jgi:diphthamide synthase subunit DPH2